MSRTADEREVTERAANEREVTERAANEREVTEPEVTERAGSSARAPPLWGGDFRRFTRG